MLGLLSFGHAMTIAFSFSLRGKDTVSHTTPWEFPQTGRKCDRRLHSHSAVTPPTPSLTFVAGSIESDLFPCEASLTPQQDTRLETLCALLDATPENLLRLQSSSDGVRGVYLNRSVKNNEILLRLPLESCLQDDDPPEWKDSSFEDSDETESFGYGNPSDWASRLASSLIDMQLQVKGKSEMEKGHSLWLSMLPDSSFLRASLPVHWTDDVVLSARCTALELAMDSAYFARAEAVEDLMSGLGRCELARHLKLTDEDLRRMCQDALDMVQTRSCRVEPKDGVQWGPPLRILAPVFDFINHGSSNIQGEGGANASFGWEGGDVSDMNGPSLVVRATVDLEANEEVLIDYGVSARPAWRCLASYGFVPEYKESEDEDVAEVFLDGHRYEVGATTVPCDLVERVSASLQEDDTIRVGLRDVDQILDGSSDSQLAQSDRDEDWSQPVTGDAENMLNPAVAVTIAKRLSDVAFQLLLVPEDTERDTDDDVATLRSTWLAASLRWSQHRILLACAMGLRDWVTSSSSTRPPGES